MDHRRVPPLLARLGELQARYPWSFVLGALLTLVPALWGILGNGGLAFKPDFSELLPDDKDSVIEMRRVSERLPGASTLTIVAEIDGGSNPTALEGFVDRIVPRLEALGPEKVGTVDYGVKETRAFFDDNKLLFARLEDLQKAHDEVLERYDYEVAKASGNLLDDDEPPPPISADAIEQRLGGSTSNSTDKDKPRFTYPDGYYMNEQGSLIAVLVRTPVSGRDAKAAFRKEVEGVVASVQPGSLDPRMRVGYTGNFVRSEEEYQSVINDLIHVGGWGLLGVLASVLLFFLRVRTLLAMGVTILIALLWTFGLTRLTIGYLNSSTGFLVSIIAGNGINYSIMYMARYIEARRDEAADVATAIQRAHRDSWLPTLAGSATAMLAYGSLILTDFRGFKHFGVISGYGMLLCWIATYVFLPAILAATERVAPSFRSGSDRPALLRGYYGVAFAKLARLGPRTVTIAGALAGVIALYASARYLAGDPMEYDMKKVRNEPGAETEARALNTKLSSVVERLGQDGMAIMADRIDQVPMLQAELNARRDAAPAGEKPFEKVVTIFSLIPTDQQEKVKLAAELRDRVERAAQRGWLSDADWRRLEPHLPPRGLKPITIADLPEQVARPFTERDGTRGRIVYIAPANGFSVWDARYLMRWADSYRYTRLPTGEVIRGSGSAVIFADMIKGIGEDAPKAILFSAVGSILVILAAFRFRRLAWGVFLPWLLGVSGLLAYLYFSDTRLNFLNFVSIPITIGIGAEYAHNMMQRYRIEGPDRVYHVAVETGGAVILCSLTTTIGYLALTLSSNQGIRSFGLSAAVGEVTCVLGAVLVLPAALFWLGERARTRKAGPATASHAIAGTTASDPATG